jgi:vancomycin resistance protein YoaR
MSRKKIAIVISGVLLGLIAILVSVSVYLSVTWKDKILPGVKVEWLEVGGLTQEEAEQKISKLQKDFLSAPIEISLNGKTINTTRAELGFSMPEPEAVAQKAYLQGRSGSFSKRIEQAWIAYQNQIVIPINNIDLNLELLESSIEPLVEGLDKPQNASLVIDDRDQITIIPGKNGMIADLNDTAKKINTFEQPFDRQIELKVHEEEPEITTADVEAMGINGLIASYTTSFDASNYNRSRNVGLATKALNNSLVKPGEVFSFNKRVGPRTAKKGYREALVIVANEFVPGLGGGVCQVSSTLYNTVLLAGLEIVERSSHSLPIAYVPLGRDATVSYGIQDFKFRNNSEHHIYIKTSVGRSSITMKIFGNLQQRKNVRLETAINSVINPKVTTKKDNALLKGKTVVEKAGTKGYRTSAYRIINGTKKLLSQDYYRPTERIVRVGTKEPPKESEPEEPKDPKPKPDPDPEPDPEPDPPDPPDPEPEPEPEPKPED